MPFSTGVNRLTFKPLSDWDHVQQSLGVIFTTRIGERVMRRMFGSAVPALLLHNLVPSTLIRFFTAIIVAIDLWEPRFRVTRIELPSEQNDPSTTRIGGLGLKLTGQYRPNALQGDFTPDPTPRSVIL